MTGRGSHMNGRATIVIARRHLRTILQQKRNQLTIRKTRYGHDCTQTSVSIVLRITQPVAYTKTHLGVAALGCEMQSRACILGARIHHRHLRHELAAAVQRPARRRQLVANRRPSAPVSETCMQHRRNSVPQILIRS